MRRRDRRAFEALSRQLAADDPRLAATLSRPVDPRYRRAVLAGRVLLSTGVVFVLVGVLLVVHALLGVGILLLLSFWLPAEVARSAADRDDGRS